MKIRADEHVSPHIVRAISDVALSDGWEITSIHSVNHQGASDVHWITEFAKNASGDVILSADKDFITLEPQINAVFDTGVRVILLPKKWGMARGCLQAAHILQWWNRIETKIQEMNTRECFSPAWNIKETGDLKKIKIDFAKAQKIRRKNAKKPK